MNTVHAIFEKGVFRPFGEVDLPEQTKVAFEPRPIAETEAIQSSVDREILEILSERYDSGEHDVAARHNEHQP